jgi:hypothetical protein
MTLEKIEYLVGELPEQPQRLTITQDAVRYESHSNLNRLASGLGVFERPLAKGDMAAIEAGLDLAAFASRPDHHGQVLSGERFQRIRLTTGEAVIEKMVGSKLAVDPGLQKLIDWLDRLAAETTKYPRSLLQLTVQDAALDRQGEFSATVAVVGGGDQPMRFRPPGPGTDSLAVYWWPYRADGGRDDVQRTPVTAVAPAAGGGFRIRCLLGGPVSVSLAVQVQYVNLQPRMGGIEVATGELYSQPVVVG